MPLCLQASPLLADAILCRASCVVMRVLEEGCSLEEGLSALEAYVWTRIPEVCEARTQVPDDPRPRYQLGVFGEALSMLSKHRFDSLAARVLDELERRLRTDKLRLEAVPYACLMGHMVLPVGSAGERGGMSQATSFLCALLEVLKGSKRIELKHALCDAVKGLLTRARTELGGVVVKDKAWEGVLGELIDKVAEWTKKDKHREAAFPALAALLTIAPARLMQLHGWSSLHAMGESVHHGANLRVSSLESIRVLLEAFLESCTAGPALPQEDLQELCKLSRALFTAEFDTNREVSIFNTFTPQPQSATSCADDIGSQASLVAIGSLLLKHKADFAMPYVVLKMLQQGGGSVSGGGSVPVSTGLALRMILDAVQSSSSHAQRGQAGREKAGLAGLGIEKHMNDLRREVQGMLLKLSNLLSRDSMLAGSAKEDGAAGSPGHLVPIFELVLRSLPLLPLASSAPGGNQTLTLLCRAAVHVQPTVNAEAARALQRMVENEPSQRLDVLAAVRDLTVDRHRGGVEALAPLGSETQRGYAIDSLLKLLSRLLGRWAVLEPGSEGHKGGNPRRIQHESLLRELEGFGLLVAASTQEDAVRRAAAELIDVVGQASHLGLEVSSGDWRLADVAIECSAADAGGDPVSKIAAALQLEPSMHQPGNAIPRGSWHPRTCAQREVGLPMATPLLHSLRELAPHATETVWSAAAASFAAIDDGLETVAENRDGAIRRWKSMAVLVCGSLPRGKTLKTKDHREMLACVIRRLMAPEPALNHGALAALSALPTEAYPLLLEILAPLEASSLASDEDLNGEGGTSGGDTTRRRNAVVRAWLAVAAGAPTGFIASEPCLAKKLCDVLHAVALLLVGKQQQKKNKSTFGASELAPLQIALALLAGLIFPEIPELSEAPRDLALQLVSSWRDRENPWTAGESQHHLRLLSAVSLGAMLGASRVEPALAHRWLAWMHREHPTHADTVCPLYLTQHLLKNPSASASFLDACYTGGGSSGEQASGQSNAAATVVRRRAYLAALAGALERGFSSTGLPAEALLSVGLHALFSQDSAEERRLAGACIWAAIEAHTRGSAQVNRSQLPRDSMASSPSLSSGSEDGEEGSSRARAWCEVESACGSLELIRSLSLDTAAFAQQAVWQAPPLLAKQLPDLAFPLTQEFMRRLPLCSAESRIWLLTCMAPWCKEINVSGGQQGGSSSSEFHAFLARLLDLSRSINADGLSNSDDAARITESKAMMALWEALATGEGNAAMVTEWLVTKGCQCGEDQDRRGVIAAGFSGTKVAKGDFTIGEFVKVAGGAAVAMARASPDQVMGILVESARLQSKLPSQGRKQSRGAPSESDFEVRITEEGEWEVFDRTLGMAEPFEVPGGPTCHPFHEAGGGYQAIWSHLSEHGWKKASSWTDAATSGSVQVESSRGGLPRSVVALALAAEALYESSSGLRPKLAPLLHGVVLVADLGHPMAVRVSQRLYAALLRTARSQFSSGAKEVSSVSMPEALWANDLGQGTDRKPESCRSLQFHAMRLLNGFDDCSGLAHEWFDEALGWVLQPSTSTSSGVFHHAVRSHHLLRAIKAEVPPAGRSKGITAILRHVTSLEASLRTEDSQRGGDGAAASGKGGGKRGTTMRLIVEAIHTMSVLYECGPGSAEGGGDLSTPQLFWGTVGMLHHNEPEVYLAALSLMESILTKLHDCSSPLMQSVLLASFPDGWHHDLRTEGDNTEENADGDSVWRHVRASFRGAQPLVFKGLCLEAITEKSSEEAAMMAWRVLDRQHP